MATTVYYTSADEPGPNAPWSVWVEYYEHPDSPNPIDGMGGHIASYPSEAIADAKANWFASEVN